nr:hypothetical protein [Burkholderia ubonensis]
MAASVELLTKLRLHVDKKKVISLMVAALTTSNAFAPNLDASDWVELSHDRGMTVSVSASSLDRKGDHADILVKRDRTSEADDRQAAPDAVRPEIGELATRVS